MSLYQDIRGALQDRLGLTGGLPMAAQRAYDNVLFTSTTNVPWIRATLMPTSGRPFSVDAQTQAHRGLFQVDVNMPANRGTAEAEVMADAIKAEFAPGERLPAGGDIVLIDYAERAPPISDASWIMIPVTVGWRCFSSRN